MQIPAADFDYILIIWQSETKGNLPSNIWTRQGQCSRERKFGQCRWHKIRNARYACSFRICTYM